MNLPLLLPKIGTRFSYHGTQFEISFVRNGTIRYSTVAGGNICQIPYERFEEWNSTGQTQYDFSNENLHLTPQNISSITRKFRYIEAALTELVCPTVVKALTAIINKIAAQIDDPSPPSPRTVSRWIFNYRVRDNNPALIEKARPGNRYLRFDPQIEQLICRGIQEIYLCKEHRDSKDVLAFIVGKAIELALIDLKLPNERTIQRRISQLDPFIVTKVKKGSHVAKRSAQAAGRKITSSEILALVEIDTHYLDIIIVDPITGATSGRPFLTCAIDVYTRAIVGTYISL